MKVEKKHLKMAIGLLVFVLIIFTAYVAFDYGTMYTCEKSGGTILENHICINFSSLGYCRIEEKIYKHGPETLVYFNISDQVGG